MKPVAASPTRGDAPAAGELERPQGLEQCYGGLALERRESVVGSGRDTTASRESGRSPVAAELEPLLHIRRDLAKLGDPSLGDSPATDDLTAAIAADRDLERRLLYLCSSTYFSSRPVASPAQAVQTFGATGLRDLAVVVVITRAFGRIWQSIGREPGGWSDSVACAQVAEFLSYEVDPDLATSAFACGLLRGVARRVWELRSKVRIPEPLDRRVAVISTDDAPGAVRWLDQQDRGILMEWRVPLGIIDGVPTCTPSPEAPQARQRVRRIVDLAQLLAAGHADVNHQPLLNADCIAGCAAVGVDAATVAELLAEVRASLPFVTRLLLS
jgi:hypothetical protein